MNFWLGKIKYQDREVRHVLVSMTADKRLRLGKGQIHCSDYKYDIHLVLFCIEGQTFGHLASTAF